MHTDEPYTPRLDEVEELAEHTSTQVVESNVSHVLGAAVVDFTSIRVGVAVVVDVNT